MGKEPEQARRADWGVSLMGSEGEREADCPAV